MNKVLVELLSDTIILTHNELRAHMPKIEIAIREESDNPALPILIERDLEIELTFQQYEHTMENQTLENFSGITADTIQSVINKAAEYKILADIDGRGHIDSPRPIINIEANTLKPITEHLLDKIRRAA